jgi:hypothetical protein
MDPDSQEHNDRFQRTLIDFLNTQLDVGFMFCRDARLEKHLTEEGDYALCKENAQVALDTVLRFDDRVENAETSAAIRTRVGELKRLLSEL